PTRRSSDLASRTAHRLLRLNGRQKTLSSLLSAFLHRAHRLTAAAWTTSVSRAGMSSSWITASTAEKRWELFQLTTRRLNAPSAASLRRLPSHQDCFVRFLAKIP